MTGHWHAAPDRVTARIRRRCVNKINLLITVRPDPTDGQISDFRSLSRAGRCQTGSRCARAVEVKYMGGEAGADGDALWCVTQKSRVGQTSSSKMKRTLKA